MDSGPIARSTDWPEQRETNRYRNWWNAFATPLTGLWRACHQRLALGDVLVHSADALRPCGLMPDPPAADVVVVLETYKKWGRRMFHAAPHRGLSLSATDVDWRSGVGPEVRGRAIDLLLLVANRRQVVDQLDGPGVATALVFSWPGRSLALSFPTILRFGRAVEPSSGGFFCLRAGP